MRALLSVANKAGIESFAKALADVDMGGVTLLREAAKNFPDVTVVTRPEDYETVLSELAADGSTMLETRRRLSIAAFQHTALYDSAIADYLRRDVVGELFPE